MNRQMKQSGRSVQASAWKQRKAQNKKFCDPIRLLLGLMVVLALVAFVAVPRVLNDEPDGDMGQALPPLKQQQQDQQIIHEGREIKKSTSSLRGQKSNGESSSVLDYVDDLIKLAQLPTSELRRKLEQDDMFQIAPLLTKCVFKEAPSWLPPRPPERSVVSAAKPFVWYEHLSKAGGTAFCKLAQRNMLKSEIPPYYCMPRDEDVPSDPDGRVGRWSNEKLLRYRQSHSQIRLVSNEWQPFPKERLVLQRSSDFWLVTTLRNPLDRLLSAYHFWGKTHNQEVVKPTFGQWLHRKLNRSVGKDPQEWPFAVHVGRYNFITWKFSNGTMPQGTRAPTSDSSSFPQPMNSVSSDEWLSPFTEAIQNLAKFDLVLILELMDTHSHKLLTQFLQWRDVKNSQVVPSGNVESNHAKDNNGEVSDQEYDLLWEANRFDMILYYWMKAVHLVRIQCLHL